MQHSHPQTTGASPNHRPPAGPRAEARRAALLAATFLALTAGSGAPATTAADLGGKTHKLASISLRKHADSLRALIVANRETYARIRETESRGTRQPRPASPDERQAHGLPNPDRMLRLAAQNLQTRGAEFSFVLRSKWPIGEAGAAQTEVEETGIDRVLRNPDEAFYADETLGGRSYFTAVYADRATLDSCVECHNRDPRSGRHNFKPGDVMGALVVRVPLEF